MVLVVLGLSFNSCEVHSYYDDAPFLGTWEAIAFGHGNHERDLYVDEFHRYVFYSDGTGVYSQSDGLRTRFYWDERGYNQIELRHSDGLREYYYYDFDGRYMLLSTTRDFYEYFLYEPRW